MRARASKDGLTLRVIAGSNNVLLAMDLEESKRKGCLGFTIERTDVDTGARRWLPNMLRFDVDPLDAADIAQAAIPAVEADPKPVPAAKKAAKKRGAAKNAPPRAPDQDAPMVSTARAPLQKFRWGDYTVDPGKSYRYRVVPRYDPAAKIVQDGKEAERRREFDTIQGGVTVEFKTENNHGHDASVFFNRGAAASRAYNSRYGDNDPAKIPDALWWLSRGLEEALIGFIGQAVDSSYAVHAAIYEFQKPKLLEALTRAAGRGVDVKVAYHARQKSKQDKPDPADKTAARNRAAIAAAGITFAKPRDADPQGAIMHNKFIVLLKKGANGSMQPIAVWTGSTNWTDGAIYGQLNLGHASYNVKIATAYNDYFQSLYNNDSARDIKKHTQFLTPVPKDRDSIPHGVTPIFSPQSKLEMIDLYAELCRTGKIVMVSAPFVLHPKILATFKKTPKGTLRFLMADKGSSFGKAGAVKLLEHDAANQVSVATTLSSALHDFQGRLLEHEESFHHSGVHIHSKIIAIDPFGQDPILVTGSANFSNNSTKTNDENSLIIRGDTAVMDIYITEFMRMFEHYWFRAHVEGKTKGGKKKKSVEARIAGLKKDDSWTDPYYTSGSREETDRLAFAGLAT
ncbi:phospholipase D-like domain-containing protein [Bradyrhizobium centrosematis]|uniref:phospholipase D-like domain-containing protein n=1 Tax=Bradyrhizobium centrosematis TaxID=1300039 RepID=UPI00216824B1|nr:phospholipase D-like domain-containing protein [Bradyrhizobium centrosematis]MCS3758891.1 phosphatidylserine/phosphatidylglycerophosphate/cardiolipin synthase-like enzyme [Bradyrhizobium centrosematis]MCS3773221.1 phosphatidylserine/phosphatidylglycerophosphate/cardiolipin synthase-like enzyme [Bradyrhizobium centrosematis]